jgi:hypothetical protein
VLAYTQCPVGGNPAGERHNPANLPGDACTPPSIVTPRLTAGGLNGTTANFKGFAKLVVSLGPTNVQFPSTAGCNPPGFGGGPACTGNWVQDVRCTAAYTDNLLPPPYSAGGGTPGVHVNPVCTGPNSGNRKGSGAASTEPDYTGSLNIIAVIRITDQANSGPGGVNPGVTCGGANTAACTDDATVQDLNFAVAADCAATPGPAVPGGNIGSTCLPRWASAGALCSCVATGKFSNLEVGVGGAAYNGGIFATDGGLDGVVPDLVADTDVPLPYARQGIFLP